MFWVVGRRAPHPEHEDRDARDEVGIGDIRDPGPEFGRAVGPSDAEGERDGGERVQEVTDTGVDDSVVEVADAAGDDERDGDVRSAVVGRGPAREDEEREDQDRDGERDEEPSLARAGAEDGAGVQDQFEFEDRGDDDNGIVRGDEFVEEVRRVLDIGERCGAIEVDGVIGDEAEGGPLGGEVEDDQRCGEREEEEPCARASERGRVCACRLWRSSGRGGLIVLRGFVAHAVMPVSEGRAVMFGSFGLRRASERGVELDLSSGLDGEASPRRVSESFESDGFAEEFADAVGPVVNAVDGVVDLGEESSLRGGEVEVERLVEDIGSLVGHVLGQTGEGTAVAAKCFALHGGDISDELASLFDEEFAELLELRGGERALGNAFVGLVRFYGGDFGGADARDSGEVGESCGGGATGLGFACEW